MIRRFKFFTKTFDCLMSQDGVLEALSQANKKLQITHRINGALQDENTLVTILTSSEVV